MKPRKRQWKQTGLQGKNMVVNTENSLLKPKTMSCCLSSLCHWINRTPPKWYVCLTAKWGCLFSMSVNQMSSLWVSYWILYVCVWSCIYQIKSMSMWPWRAPLNCIQNHKCFLFILSLNKDHLISCSRFAALCCPSQVFSPAQVASSHTSASNKHFLEKKIKWVSTRGN